jgi:hypothetical protein
MNLPSKDIAIRLYSQTESGEWVDWQEEYDLSDFAGFLPGVGDMFLAPGVLQGLDRCDPKNRRLLTVVQRVFNPRDLSNYVALVVTEQIPTGRESVIVSAR